MKRLKIVLACLIIVALLAGCATIPFLCTGKQAVLDGLQFIVNQSQSIITQITEQYPNAVPPAVQAVLNGFQKAHDLAQAAAAKVCPTTADLTAAQEKMSMANQVMMASLKTGYLRLDRR